MGEGKGEGEHRKRESSGEQRESRELEKGRHRTRVNTPEIAGLKGDRVTEEWKAWG